jgi:hypothetical protein
MKINEIITSTQQPAPMQPSIVQRQARVNSVVKQIAASEQERPATRAEMVAAHMQYSQMKRKNDEAYAQRLRQQAMQAVQAQTPKPQKEGGRYKR